jgi:hypothetical protein
MPTGYPVGIALFSIRKGKRGERYFLATVNAHYNSLDL